MKIPTKEEFEEIQARIAALEGVSSLLRAAPGRETLNAVDKLLKDLDNADTDNKHLSQGDWKKAITDFNTARRDRDAKKDCKP